MRTPDRGPQFPGTPRTQDGHLYSQDQGRPYPGCSLLSGIYDPYEMEHVVLCIIYSRNAPWIASFLDNTDKRDDLWWIGSQVFWITDDHPVWIFEIFKIHVPTYTYIISFQDSQKYLNRKRNRIFFKKQVFITSEVAIYDLSMTNSDPQWPGMTPDDSDVTDRKIIVSLADWLWLGSQSQMQDRSVKPILSIKFN